MSKVARHNHYEFGQAPFRFVGIWSAPSPSLAEANPTAYSNAMADKPQCCRFQCDHCGLPIAHHHIISDAHGQRFSVGSECIAKSGDVDLLAKSAAAKKDCDRKARRDKAAAKREQERQAREDELQRQKDANGGLTDYELERQAQLQAEQDLQDRRAALTAEYGRQIRDGRGGFCDSIADDLDRGELPAGRGLSLTIEILAKQAGRKNSAAYNARYDELADRFEHIATVLEKIT